MLSQNIFDFLTELKQNNTRDWFQANKKRYDAVKKEVEDYINKLIPAIHSFDKGIEFITAKDCMFRINRDVRFSNDKSPYKTNFGTYIVKGGKKSFYGGYYLHLDPEECFIGGGIWMPPADKVKLIRNEIYFNAPEYKKILADKTFIKYFKELHDPQKLKTAPKDFPKDFPDIDLLKFKSFTPIHTITKEQVVDKNFINYLLDVFKAMYPLNSFLNRALDN